ncbi:hypothetical protein RIF29_20261 [Crotalaria pallida]|uniref:MADS-box domain-containing protein n=1 Tax=Crotalaria pallida TaxID=3830 RepID=A0AAN9F560_CROPI
MTRSKVTLAYIGDVNARKACFRKRQKGIMKKVSEITVLCGIQACVIIKNPFNSEIEVWPNPEKAKQVIERYHTASIKNETKNMTQEGLLELKISKAQDKLDKQRKENNEKKMTQAMLDYMKTRKLPNDLTVAYLEDMDKFAEQYMKKIENKIAILD